MKYNYEKLECHVHKILPLVYDDSLSYYEVLCKVIAKVNELGEFISDTLEDDVKAIVEKYFNAIMIDAVYDEPSETITLKKELVVGDGVHTYSPSSTTMVIE